MPRILIPNNFSLDTSTRSAGPLLCLVNPAGHRLSVHPISSSIVRVVHELPPQYAHKNGSNGITFEPPASDVAVVSPDSLHLSRRARFAQAPILQRTSDTEVTLETADVHINVDFVGHGCPRLTWRRPCNDAQAEPFLADSRTRAYSFDAASGAVLHYVSRPPHISPSSLTLASAPRLSAKTTSPSPRKRTTSLTRLSFTPSAMSLSTGSESRVDPWRRRASSRWKDGTPSRMTGSMVSRSSQGRGRRRS